MIRLASIAILVAAPSLALGCSDSSSCRAPCGVTSTDSNGGSSSTVESGNGGSGPVRPADVVCKASFAGNYTGTAVNEGKCATLSKVNGSWVLAIHISDKTGTTVTNMSFTLGKSPSPGKLGPESIGTWTAIGVRQTSCTASSMAAAACVPPATCELSAGNDTVPAGTFSLQLTEVDLTDPKPVVHGVVETTQKVQPSVGADCGIDDFETIAVVF